jgi:hypothetical protein
MRQLLEQIEAKTNGVIVEMGRESKPQGIGIAPHRVYFIGSGSNPQMVVTTRVDGEQVWFVEPPYSEEIMNEKRAFARIAFEGTQRALNDVNIISNVIGIDSLGKIMSARIRKSLRGLMAGKPGEAFDQHEFDEMTVTVVPAEDAHWSDDPGDVAMAYGSVRGVKVNGQQVYRISYMPRWRMSFLQRDKRFHIVDEKHD